MTNTIYNIDIDYDVNFDASGNEREVGLDISTNRKLYQRDGTLLVPLIGNNAYAEVNLFTVVKLGNVRKIEVTTLDFNTTGKRASFVGINITTVGNVSTIKAFFRHWTAGNATNINFVWSALYSKIP
jgi:hypothetical protein